jgi:hypothetical protein
MKKLIILLASIIILLCACEPEPIAINVPQAPVKMVIVSQLIPNENVLLVTLSRNFSALKNGVPSYDSNGITFDSTLLLRNGTVILQSANGTDTLKELSPGIYSSQYIDELNLQNYTIHAYHSESGLSAWAQTKQMSPIVFDTIYPISNSFDGKGNASIYYSFTDLPDDNNWYLVNYIVGNKKDDTRKKTDIDYIASRMLNQSNSFDLLTEKDMKAGRYSVVKKIGNIKLGDTIGVAISNISKGYYDFLSVQKKSAQLINQIKAEVINFPTNVQNGYGFFTMHKPDIRLMELKN